MDAEIKIERISEILAFLLHLMGAQTFSKTKLVKLIYLLDVIHSRRDGTPFSGIEYKSYYYGPYSEEIEASLDLLSELGYISVTYNVRLDGTPYYHIQLKNLAHFGYLTGQERLQIRKDMQGLVDLDLRDVLDITYKTKEFKEVPLGEVITL